MSQSASDFDGRRHLARGVAMSWVAQMLQIASGFIIPRLIDQKLGRDILGIWDLGWSMVSYFSLFDGGVGSTINRHVALHRAEGDTTSLNRIVSSVAMLQRALGIVVFLLTLFLAWGAPKALKLGSPDLDALARNMILLLGISMAIGTSGAVFGGVLTGCHRWSVQHGITAVCNILTFLGMGLVLWMGWGLLALAAVHCASEMLMRILRAISAYKACPGLDIRFRHADFATLKQMFTFGGKMYVGRMSQVVLNQTVSVMIASFLGPTAVALFSRPRSLVRQAAVFPQKYGNILVPTAAALLGKKDQAEIQKFATDSMRHGLYLFLPLVLLLTFCGGSLLHLWMGADYANPTLIAILALGFLAENAYQPLNNILFALNFHGRPSLVSVVGAAVALFGVSLVLAGGSRSLEVVALAVVIPWSLVHGVFLPAYACRRLGVPLGAFLRDIWGGPLLCMIPYSVCLLAAQWFFPQPLLALATGGLTGGTVLFVLYWFRVFPERWKNKIRKKMGLTVTA